MTPREKKVGELLEQMNGLIDGLFRRVLIEQSWNMALHEQVAALVSKQSGKPLAEVKAELSREQKRLFQKLLEDIEKKNPNYAGLLDDRDIQDVL